MSKNSMSKRCEQLHELLRRTVIEKGIGYPQEVVFVVLEDILESYVETAEICIGATFSNNNLDEWLKYTQEFETDDNKLGLAAFGYRTAGIMALGQRYPAAAEYFRKAGEVRLKQLRLECQKLGVSYDKIIAIEGKPVYPVSALDDMMRHLAGLAKSDLRIALNAERSFNLLYESVDALKQSPEYETLILDARAEIMRMRSGIDGNLQRIGLRASKNTEFIATTDDHTSSVRGVER